MKFIPFLFVWFSLAVAEFTFAGYHPKPGMWIGKLALNSSTNLPFRMVFSGNKNTPSLAIHNGEEIITLVLKNSYHDTLIYSFPEFDSDLYFVSTSNSEISGYWHNKNKKGNYTIPFSGHYCSGVLFECEALKGEPTTTLARKWKTEFEPNSKGMFPAIGLFNQKDSLLSGTFLTETGDYRFLDGNFFGNRLFLSCFDGSHAFLFTAELKNDTLKGVFYSGKHYKSDWVASEDEKYELTNPNKLTYVVNQNPLKFEFKDLKGASFQYPNENHTNKVTIVQIMGSWCPNCMDETRYYMDLYKKYHDQGLEIILIGYEVGVNETEYQKKLEKLQIRHSIPFTMLVGGAANKNKASEDFSMLNEIISFPTSIFIDKAGNIGKVHTGFNGPSTGEYYTEYMQETEKYIQKLLKN